MSTSCQHEADPFLRDLFILESIAVPFRKAGRCDLKELVSFSVSLLAYTSCSEVVCLAGESDQRGSLKALFKLRAREKAVPLFSFVSACGIVDLRGGCLESFALFNIPVRDTV